MKLPVDDVYKIMCELSPIQPDWKPRVGDISLSDNVALFRKELFILSKIEGGIFMNQSEMGLSAVALKPMKESHTWLPSQDAEA